MRIVEPHYVFTNFPESGAMLLRLERAGRICYQSSPKGDPADFVRMLISKGHHSALEHESFSVRFVVDRGISHELVRHRLASFSQESTRYCNYGKEDIEFIKPVDLREDSMAFNVWKTAMLMAEDKYTAMINHECSPQIARSVLPNSLKTELVMTANLREWRHVLALRTSPAAHPDMRHIMRKLLAEFKAGWPIVFDDIGLSVRERGEDALS
jgi:thymidylate synthase, flavin-dependent